MCQVKFANQAIQCARLLQRIQVLALDILDKRHRDGRLIGDVPDNGRNFLEPRHLRSAPAALACDDLVALRALNLADGPCNDGLDDTLRPDRRREVLERILANIDARLVLAALQQVDGQLTQAIRMRFPGDGSGVGNGFTQEGVEAATESFLWCHL
jgi:hypothetical protein